MEKKYARLRRKKVWLDRLQNRIRVIFLVLNGLAFWVESTSFMTLSDVLKCDHCPKTFSQRSNYRSHLKVHGMGTQVITEPAA